MQRKLNHIRKSEVRYEEYFLDDASIILVAFGTAARVAQTAVKHLRQEGHAAGLFRPISLWPFPEQRLAQLAAKARAFVVVEMNAGQMLHDVREAVGAAVPVKFVGRMGGVIPMPDEIEQEIYNWLACGGQK